MKVPTQSKRFYQTLLIAIATIVGVSICETSIARPRGGGGSFPRRENAAPSSFRRQPGAGNGSNQIVPSPAIRGSDRSVFQNLPSSGQNEPQVRQFQQRVQEIKNSPQFQQRIQEVKNNSQFQQRVQEIKASPQFQQRVQEIRQNLQTNPEAQQTLQNFQQSRQQFKIERREDWQKYLNYARDERKDNRYYNNPYYWNVGYGYDYFWDGYYPNYFAPFTTLSVGIFGNNFDRYDYDSGRYNEYSSPGSENARVSSLPEGFITVALNSLTYYYYLGTFYLRDSTTGNYAVTPAPVGAVVPYIPTEYKKVVVNGVEYYQYAGIYYRPTYVDGQRLYKVVKV